MSRTSKLYSESSIYSVITIEGMYKFMIMALENVSYQMKALNSESHNGLRSLKIIASADQFNLRGVRAVYKSEF